MTTVRFRQDARAGGSRGFGFRLAGWVVPALLLGAPVAAEGKAKDKAAAQPRGLAEKSRLLRQQGIAALTAKDSAGAYDAFAQAYRLSPDPETLFQLGRLAWQSGRTVAAQDLMRRFLADPASAGDAAAKKEAEQLVEQPRPASGEVSIVGERGALVLVDEKVTGMLPLPLPLLLASGEHRITLEVGARRIEGPVKVLPGRLSELRFNMSSDAVVSRVVPAVVWIPEFSGVPAAALRQLSQVVEQGVQKQRMSVVPKGTALAQAPRLADCLEQLDCLDKLATANEADYLLTSAVEATGDLAQGDWTMRLSLVEAVTGDYAVTLTETCKHCTADQASTALDTLVTKVLREGMVRPRGTLSVISSPPGADVLLTERKLGQTPYQRAAFVGSYAVVVKQSGYKLHTATVVVEEGKKATLKVDLVSEQEAAKPPIPVVKVVVPPPPPPPVVKVVVPPPPPPPVRVGRPRWRVALGASALGGGVLLGGLGVSGLLQHGKQADALGQTYFDTQTKGAALLAVGGVLAATGAVLIAIPGPAGNKKVALRWSGSGLMLTGEY